MAEVKGFQWKLRRMVDRLAAFFESGTTLPYTGTSDAIAQLRETVDAELKTRRNRCKPAEVASENVRGQKRNLAAGPSRKHYQRSLRLKTENDQLRAKLAKQTTAKTCGENKISPEWIVKIFLSEPGQNARGLTKAFRDIVGLDANTVSRPTIDKVRGAWVEFYKKIMMKLAADRVAATLAAANIERVAFAFVILMQVQDEAELRFRSGELQDLLGIHSRGRASKVQQHVVTLITKHGALELPTEMEALGDKTALTLCTSFERLVRSIVDGVFPATGVGAVPQASVAGRPPAEVWLLHVLVGDGIGTNEAAAKRLWACIKERGLGPRVRYLLMVIVCGTHQSGLVAKSAVTGRAAAAAARGKLHEDIAGVTVRLFKFLVNDYFDTFVFFIHEWIFRDLQILQPHEVDAAGHASPLSWRAKHTVGAPRGGVGGVGWAYPPIRQH